MPELRKDPLHGHWVIIATERAKRPSDYTFSQRSLSAPFCPFCPGHEDATPHRIATYHGDDPSAPWQVRVIPNKYPALRVEGQVSPFAEGPYDALQGVGAHEVIIEAAEHVSALTALSVAQTELVVRAWRERVADLAGDSRLKCAIVFKNHGAQAGASLEHAHSQLVALPMIPSRHQRELERARAYFEFKGRSVFADILAHELRDRSRLIIDDPDIVAFAPYASRSPFEVWMLPRRPRAAFESGDAAQDRALARVLNALLRRMERALNSPPFNLILMSAPYGQGARQDYCWRVEIIPALQRFAGFEWGSGDYINPTPPEDAARHLRDIELD